MEINQLMKEAFSTCFVINGNITFIKNYSSEQLAQIYSKFCADLLSCNIPHYRVIGIWFAEDTVHGKSMFQTNDVYGMSLIQLGKMARFIIPKEIGGNNPQKGCFYGKDEEVINLHTFEEKFGWTDGRKIEDRKANYLMKSKDVIGSVMGRPEIADESQSFEYHPENFKMAYNSDDINDTSLLNTEITTETLIYTNHSYLGEASEKPQLLLSGIKISELHAHVENDGNTCFFIMRGTGSMTYEETQELFWDPYSRICPCATRWDLSEFFTCRHPMGQGGNVLSLSYKDYTINDDVLTHILQNYGKDMV